MQHWLKNMVQNTKICQFIVMKFVNYFRLQVKLHIMNYVLKDLQKKWDLMFNEYYVNNIHKSISSIGWWILEKLGIYNRYNGIKNNCSESLNRYVCVSHCFESLI